MSDDDWKEEFFRGYAQAVTYYGIWKSGTQVIGCIETPVKEVLQKKAKQLGIKLEDTEWRSYAECPPST